MLCPLSLNTRPSRIMRKSSQARIRSDYSDGTRTKLWRKTVQSHLYNPLLDHDWLGLRLCNLEFSVSCFDCQVMGNWYHGRYRTYLISVLRYSSASNKYAYGILCWHISVNAPLKMQRQNCTDPFQAPKKTETWIIANCAGSARGPL